MTVAQGRKKKLHVRKKAGSDVSFIALKEKKKSRRIEKEKIISESDQHPIAQILQRKLSHFIFLLRYISLAFQMFNCRELNSEKKKTDIASSEHRKAEEENNLPKHFFR